MRPGDSPSAINSLCHVVVIVVSTRKGLKNFPYNLTGITTQHGDLHLLFWGKIRFTVQPFFHKYEVQDFVGDVC